VFQTPFEEERTWVSLHTSEDMKNVFILIIFLHLVKIGNSQSYGSHNFAPGYYPYLDRQWNTDDARQNCTLKCKDECVQCEQPKKCHTGQEKCGEKPPEMHPDCPSDDICAPMGCICKFLVEL